MALTATAIVGGLGVADVSIEKLDRMRVEPASKNQTGAVEIADSLLPGERLSWLAIVLATACLSGATMAWRTSQFHKAIDEGRAELATAHKDAKLARQQADQAKAIKSRFLSNMNHELRTPLNGVLGMAQIMKMHELTPDQRERLDMLYQSGTALLGVLSNIMEISALDTGVARLRNEPFAPAQLVEETCAVFAAAASSKDIVLRFTVAHFGHHLRGDDVRLRQILSNLIANAIKFTDAGAVTVCVGPVEGGVRFIVADTGPGISLAERKLLFQRFSQLDDTPSRRFEGMGLGLAICSETAELMGGSLTLESEPGQGATFAFTVPLERESVSQSSEGSTYLND